ncbi:hydrogenase expression/formation protein HypD [Thermoplasmatales archaeon BRNA1]|nr:hydrogenase expression/formation protein HypD [Thermoplasmatales archaeon BRNA1]
MTMFKYRDEETAAKIVKAIKDLDVKCRVMHICGTHQDTIVRFGLTSLLEDAGIEVHQGPGCPVCVTTSREIADAITMARNGLTICAFGDMMRVPTTIGSLFDAKADGCDVRIVYSIEDAVRMARAEPAKKFVFVGVGFETTAPSTGVPLVHGDAPENFTVYSCHRYTVPCIDKILGMGEVKIDGLIQPGHVCVITGLGPFRKFSEQCGIPQVVCGFEPLDMLMSCYLLAKQIHDGKAVIENEYSRLVRDNGNEKARQILSEVFYPTDGEWRGFPVIENSIMTLKPEFADHDAKKVYEDILKKTPSVEEDANGCSCGEVLRGLIDSEQCPLFGTACKPTSPQGPCMVSMEGNCNIAYRFRGRL